MDERTDTLKALLSLNKPIEDINTTLSKFDWDSDELVVIEIDHIRQALKRYISGELNEAIIENWANAIECRDDVGLSEEAEDVIAALIHELANPELTQKLTPERAQVLVKSLEA